MRKLLLLLAVPILCRAQLTLTLIGATQTQAVIQEREYSGTCTITVSPTAGGTTIPDFNGAEYSGASTDTGRADTITQSDGSRLVTIGHMNADRALAQQTAYYVSVSGCGTASISFVTAPIANGESTAWPVPFNTGAYGNRDWPGTINNLLTQTSFIDPLTGLVVYEASQPTYRTGRTGANSSATVPSGFLSFAETVGGSTWSNPAHLVNGATSNASTTDTTALDLYPDPSTESAQNSQYSQANQTSLNDLGVVMYLGGTDASAANRTANVCVFLHPTSGCIGNTIAVAGPQGAIAHVTGSSNDPDAPFPTAFPTAFFAGWGNLFIARNSRATTDTLSADSGVLTLDSVSQTSHFDPGMIAGDKIYIAGSSPTCVNNMCTLSGPPASAGTATVSEAVTVSTGTAFTAYQWGVRIAKTTATGTLTIGATYKLAWSLNTGSNGPAVVESSNLPYTTGDGKAGHFSVVDEMASGNYYMVFLATDGTSRETWAGHQPNSTYFTSTLGWNVNDTPPYSGSNDINFSQFHHDPTNANVWYYFGQNSAGNKDLYKLTYATGGLSSGNSWGYTLGFNMPTYTLISPSDNWIWSLVTSNTTNLSTLIPAAGSVAVAYNAHSSLYGTTDASWSFLGVAGDGRTAYFQNEYACGQGCPAWILLLDMPTRTITNMIHTLDGTGTNGTTRYGGNHNNTVRQYFSTPTFTSANNWLNAGNTSDIFGGPFLIPIQYVCRGFSGSTCMAWSTNTSLDWPINSGSGGTAGTAVACPGTVPYPTGASCILVRVPTGGSCNVYAGSSEAAAFPCPSITGTFSGWNCTSSTCSQPVQLAVGDIIADYTLSSGDSYDYEHFRVNQIATTGDTGYWDVYLQRSASIDYCCPATNSPANSFNCEDSNGQFQHASGWMGTMLSPQRNGCFTQTAIVQGQAQTGQSLYEIGRTIGGGHGDISPALTAGNGTWVGANVGMPNASFASNWAIPPPDSSRAFYFNLPTFAGVQAPAGNGSVQQYTSTAPGTVSPPWFLDANTLNNSGGGNGPENISPLGSRTLTHVTGNIYTITVLGTASNANYKNFPMIGYAGRFNLSDVSGPSSNIATSPYTMCYAYNAGECYAGSTAGTVYLNVPTVYDPGYCANGQSWANIPCVILGWPGTGGFRQFGWTAPDNQGVNSKFLSYFFGGPGVAYGFAGLSGIGGNLAYASAQMTAGWGPISWFTSLPIWVADTDNRTVGGGITVQVPSGTGNYARVHFGYSRFTGAAGSPGNFYCSGRAEACNTSTASGSPYSFDSETGTTSIACSSGCTITVPAMAPNMVYWQIQVSSNGATWTNWGDVQAGTVP